ncbi:MAG: pitrilysin family protein, partial [Leptospira sp.]|nr:pitrilysin family protein [Leptospira sp.]
MLRLTQKTLLFLLVFITQPKCNYLLDLGTEPFYVHEYKLENGLTVLLSVNKENPVVQTSILINAGSAYDPDDATGLAHYLEHMLFKGTSQIGSTNYSEEKKLLDQIEDLFEKYRETKDISLRKKIYTQIDKLSNKAATYVIPKEFSRLQASLGAVNVNAFTTFDRTFYVSTIPSNQIKNWLTLEVERFKDPVFRTFHTELEAVFEEKNLQYSKDETAIYNRYMELLFPVHPYGLKNPIGNDEDLKNPSIKKIKEYFDNYYVPSNMAICISGDIDPGKVLLEIQNTFGMLKKKEMKALSFENKVIKKNSHSFVSVNNKKKELIFGIKIPKSSSNDVALTETLATVLTNGYSGLLDNSLYYSQNVEKVYTNYSEMKDFLILNIFVQVSKKGSVDEIITVVNEALDQIAREEISEELLTAIKENQMIQLQSNRLSNDFRISHMSEMFLSGWDSKSLSSLYSFKKQITKSDLSLFVNDNVKDNLTILETVNGSRNIPKIAKPKISTLVFSEQKQSEFAKKYSNEPEFEIKPVFADYKKQIIYKTYENGNQFVYQKNNRNQLYKLKLIIENGAWLSPYLSVAVDYWRHLGTDLYTASALSSKFFTFGTTINIFTRGDHLEIEMKGEDKNFESSIRLLEHSIISVSPSKDIWESQILNSKEFLKERTSDVSEIDFALYDYALHQNTSVRFFNASPSDLENFTSSSAVDILENLLKYKCTIIYYGSLSIEELESNYLQSYVSSKNLKETSHLRKVMWNQNSKPSVYFLNRLIPHAEINFIAPFLSNSEVSNEKITVF